MTGEILSSNHNMLELAGSLGFSIRASTEEPNIRVATRRL
jgi:hypothetical protein